MNFWAITALARKPRYASALQPSTMAGLRKMTAELTVETSLVADGTWVDDNFQ
jgi:hypothetical protein